MAERALLAAVLAVAAAYLLMALKIPMDPWTAAETINTRTLPIVYGALLACVALALWIRAPAQQPDAGAEPLRWPRLVGVVAMVVGLLGLIRVVPFWAALGLLLVGLAFWLGERKAHRLLLLSASVPLAGWLGVEQLLGLYLPD